MRSNELLRVSWLIGILLCFVSSVLGKVVGSERNDVNQNGTVSVVNIQDLNKTQYLNQNFRAGSYNYGYDIKPDGPNGQFHHENKAEDMVVYGCYGYIDPTNKPQITYYVSDSWGYRPVPVGHPTKLFFPADHPEGSTEMKGIERQWVELEFPKQCANYEQEALAQVESNNPNPLTRVSPPLNFIPSAAPFIRGPSGPPTSLATPYKPAGLPVSAAGSNIPGVPGKPGGPGSRTSGGYGGEGGSGGQVSGSATAHGGKGGDGGHGGSATGSATANGAGGGAGGKGGNASGSSTANGGNGGNGGDGGDASGSSVANGGYGSAGGNGGTASGSSTASGGSGATGGKGGTASGSSTANGGNGSAAGNGGIASGSSVANGGDAGYAGTGGKASGSSTANGGNSGQGGHGGTASGSSTANGGHSGKAGNGGNASGSSTSNGGNAGKGGNGGNASGSSVANAGSGGDAGNGGNASGSSAANGGKGGAGGNGSGGSSDYVSNQGSYGQVEGGGYDSHKEDIQRHTSSLQKPNAPLFPETGDLLSEDRYTPENINQNFPSNHNGVPTQGPPGINTESGRPSSAERQRPATGPGSGGYQYQRPPSGAYEYPRPDVKPTPSVGHQRPPAETQRPNTVFTQPPYSTETQRPQTPSPQQPYPTEAQRPQPVSTQQPYPTGAQRPQGGTGQRYPSSQQLPSEGTSPAPKPYKPRQPNNAPNGYYPKRPVSGSFDSIGGDQPSFGDRFQNTNNLYPSKEPGYQQGSIEVPSGGYVPPPDSSESNERDQNNLGNDFGDQPSPSPSCNQGGCGSCNNQPQQPQEIDYSQIPGAVVSNVPVIFYPDCRTNAFTRPAIVPFCPSLQPSPPPASCSHHQPLTMKFPAGNNPYSSQNIASSRGAYPSNFVNSFPQHQRQARRVVRRSRNQHRTQV